MATTVGVVPEKAPLVSIIMPAYNAARHIAETLDTVLAQTYAHWELVVVDDGSTDATSALVASYAQRDPRIRYLYQANARQSRARNNGITHAQGDYIAFLDADDLWLPHKLAVQVRAMQAHPVDLVFADAYVFESHFDASAALPVLGAGRGTYAGLAGLPEFLMSNRIPMLTVLTTRAALAKVGNFTEDKRFPNAEDYHLWLKMLLAGCVLQGLPEVLGAYREHTESVSSADRACLPYVVEAKANLLHLHPGQRALLLPSVQQSIRRILGEVAKEDGAAYYASMARYLQLGGKPYYQPIFAALQTLGAKKLAVRASYFIFNYL